MLSGEMVAEPSRREPWVGTGKWIAVCLETAVATAIPARQRAENPRPASAPVLPTLEQTHGVQENQQDGDRNRKLQQEHPTLVERAQPAAREEFLLA